MATAFKKVLKKKQDQDRNEMSEEEPQMPTDAQKNALPEQSDNDSAIDMDDIKAVKVRTQK